MRRYCDVPVTITVTGYDCTAMSDIHVTFRQGDTMVDVTNVTVGSSSSLSLVLTQQETQRFVDGMGCFVQLNYIDTNGLRKASDIVTLGVDDNLLRRILSHE